MKGHKMGLDGYLANAGDPLADGTAGAVTRGIMRLFSRHDIAGIAEVPLPNGRRADVMAVDGKGQILIVEIKCSRQDLLGDTKWPDYFDYCDRYYWAVPAGFDLKLFDSENLWPSRTGLICADQYDAEIIRPAPTQPLATARRKAEILRFARRSSRRLMAMLDPGYISDNSGI
ncbi:MmcB family DNA repair protein [Rhizorhapis suberifaciens]|nr:MmcB family DNA repair protein [Rhizorhapis suberifaciens]